jgi:hypothetical protein
VRWIENSQSTPFWGESGRPHDAGTLKIKGLATIFPAAKTDNVITLINKLTVK